MALAHTLGPQRNEGVLIINSELGFDRMRIFGSATELPSKALDDCSGQTFVDTTGATHAHAVKRCVNTPSACIAPPDFFGGTVSLSFRFCLLCKRKESQRHPDFLSPW